MALEGSSSAYPCTNMIVYFLQFLLCFLLLPPRRSHSRLPGPACPACSKSHHNREIVFVLACARVPGRAPETTNSEICADMRAQATVANSRVPKRPSGDESDNGRAAVCRFKRQVDSLTQSKWKPNESFRRTPWRPPPNTPPRHGGSRVA